MQQESMVKPEPLKGFAEAPAYHIEIVDSPKRVKVKVNGVLIADSKRAKILRETRLSPVYYLPKADIRMDLLEPTDHHTHCPFKGNANYWTLKVGDREVENGAWSYEEPLPEVAEIKGYLAFYQSKMDALFEAEEEVDIDPSETGHRHQNPYMDWLLREAWEAADSRELVQRLAQKLRENGVPLWRLNLLIGTLNPQIVGNAFVWQLGESEIQVRPLRHEGRHSEAFKNSPLVPIYEGRGGLRRRLEGPDAQFDFPILQELHAEGATDYVAMPITFSDGHVNVISLAANRAGGFSTSDLGQIYEILPILSRLFEVQALRRSTRSLLDTYLGERTGDLVLNGRVRRGDGENIPAVVWYCDLRDSTGLASKLPRETYLLLLNEFFDGAAGAVKAEGGEVLKFIGDAVMAIFPIESCAIKTAQAAQAALRATRAAQHRFTQANQAYGADLGIDVDGRISLSLGDLTYGNVGSNDRLDFTVIGPAANEVARVADLCKVLEQPVLATAAFADQAPHEFRTVGFHDLRGVPGTHEIFTLLPQSSASGS